MSVPSPRVRPDRSAARHLAPRFAPVLLAGALASATLPRVAAAQGIRGILRGIERATRPDSTTPRPGANANGETATAASGGALRIVEQHIDGADSLAQRFALDTGLTRVPAAGACGVARACVPGWDLRVARVALPGALVPAGAPVMVTTEVENRGRQPAPAAELRLCLAQLPLRGCGAAMRDAVPLPPLGPGERVVVRRALEMPAHDRESSGWAAAAEVDPDRTLGEREVADNAAVSTPVAVRLPALQLLTLDLPADPRAGSPFPVTIAVRNTSPVAASPATEVQLSGALFCGAPIRQFVFGGGPNRLAVPALAPRQTVRYRVLVPDAARCRTVRPAQLTLAVDPDRGAAWGPGQERELRRTYSVR